jgi:hypothetical protein
MMTFRTCVWTPNSQALAVETVVRLSGERARLLGRLAAERGTSEEALLAEALDMLFRHHAGGDEALDDAELLRRMEAELGPSRARPVPPLDPARPEVTQVVPIHPELIRRPEEDASRPYEHEAKRIASEILGYLPEEYIVYLLREEPAGVLYDRP